LRDRGKDWPASEIISGVAADRRNALQGNWVHSHEEDTEDTMVFRPATHGFPPSRGRMSLDLRPDGSYVESSPGPVDVPEQSRGHWSLDDGRLTLEAEGERPGHAWEIAMVENERLAVRKPNRSQP
jgi:hypothetical protein